MISSVIIPLVAAVALAIAVIITLTGRYNKLLSAYHSLTESVVAVYRGKAEIAEADDDHIAIRRTRRD